MEYSINIKELINRPYITKGKFPDFHNKMTDDEIKQYNKESYDLAIEEGIDAKFPDMNAALMAHDIDRDILYKLFEMGEIRKG